MDESAAVAALAALAQPSRLQVFRALARVAPDPLPAGSLAAQLDVPASTLSFHLQHLTRAGLVTCTRDGRQQLYALDVGTFQQLIWFLGEDCCQGRIELCASPAERIAANLGVGKATESERETVLFLCSRNSARSQLAEAILRDRVGDELRILSAGLRPSVVDPLVPRVLEEVGIEPGDLQSKDLGRFLGKASIHLAIVVCQEADDDCPRLHPFARHRLSWPFPDPAKVRGDDVARLEAFRAARDAIAARIDEWLAAGRPVIAAKPRRIRAMHDGAGAP